MKRIKRIASLVLAMVMVFAMSVTAFATSAGSADANTTKKDEGNFTITINDSTPGYTYGAYQIFAGDLDNNTNTLSNISWGLAIDEKQAEEEFPGLDAKTVAENLQKAVEAENENAAEGENASNDGTTAQEYAAKFARCIKGQEDKNGNWKVDTKVASERADKIPYQISGLKAGYYLVLNESVPADADEDVSYTRYILRVVTSVSVEPKRGTVESDKDVKDAVEGAVKANEAPIGEEMTFRLWAKLPDNYDKYKEYYLTFNDFLTKGLTAQVNDIKVYVVEKGKALEDIDGSSQVIIPESGGEGVVEVTDNFYKNVGITTVQHNGKDAWPITVGIQNLKRIANINNGDYVIVTYKAKLNKDAVIGIEGNPNYVYVEHDNDPNNSGDGEETPPDEPEEPNPKHPTGETPESETITYTTELVIEKTNEDGDILPGAEFTLKGDAVDIKLESQEIFEQSDDGMYWELVEKDSSGKTQYTTEAPVTAEDETNNVEDYVDINVKYIKRMVLAVNESDKEYKAVGIVESDGKVRFTGLGAGNYTLSETITPTGYNTMEDVTFTITFDKDSNEKFTATSDNETILTLGREGNATFTSTIVNYKGSLLPSTGGIGTTIFYVVGSILVIGAGILLVTKRRMKAQ